MERHGFWSLLLGYICCIYTSRAQTRTEFVQALLIDYDSRIPPNFENDTPTHVDVNMYINSIDSINEQTMDFSINAFIQQEWNDSRLQFYGVIPVEYLELDSKLMNDVWVPDLYITNEKRASFHDVTVPNRMLHLYSDGFIRYRLRVSITASCPMKLHRYPLDRQICSLKIQSFAYTTNRLVFRWRKHAAVQTSDTLELPQFSLEDVHVLRCDTQSANFTCIQMDLHLNRNIGFYMIQIYIPTILIVLLSWVSFWLSIDAVPARISLGILTVLTMTTQKTTAASSLPRVSYVKAIDVWMAACLIFVFAALLEFAFVNVMERRQIKRVNSFRGIEQGRPIVQSNVKNTDFAKLGKRRAKQIDNVSRIMFPSAFGIFSLMYWMIYIL